MATDAVEIRVAFPSRPDDALRNAIKQLRSSELVFAVVGYAGSGTSFVATQVKQLLEKELQHTNHRLHLLKAREFLDEYAALKPAKGNQSSTKLERTRGYQELGDEMRKSTREFGAVAAYAVRKIQRERSGTEGQKNIFVIDSLKHPAEADLLRSIYGDAFCLIGVGCRPDIRNGRLARKFELTEDAPDLRAFITRDAEDSLNSFGQQVNRTFHLSDYFVDNTHDSTSRREYVLPDQIKRLFDLIFTTSIKRPQPDERGLYHAHSASMKSSCLSRQVGAAILDESGNLLSVGANEVPRAGGGTYDGLEGATDDHRCFASNKFCSNVRQQDAILTDVYERLRESGQLLASATKDRVVASIAQTRIKSLIEFSRSVHAEMDAIISLARSGTKLPPGATLFTTTYPCHSCARHIVAAGIGRVVYLEPYSKSMAIELHADSIADNVAPEDAGPRVKFLPYQGVSPGMYRRVYLKTKDLKDTEGRVISASQRGALDRSSLWTKAYTDLEKDVATFIDDFEESQRAKH